MHYELRRTAFVGKSHHRLPASTKARVHCPIPDINNNDNNNTATGMSSPPNTNLDIQLRDITGRTATLAHTYVRGITDAGLGKRMRPMCVSTSPRRPEERAGGSRVGGKESVATLTTVIRQVSETSATNVPVGSTTQQHPRPTRQYTSKSTRKGDSGTTSTREMITTPPCIPCPSNLLHPRQSCGSHGRIFS
ncbi:hypothetical protein DFH27DRAFT_615974 [Peziza echinospora]|nr:hypothetical protein DFH27DRAFT_615974 [Peziza echinospora]